MEPYKLTKQDIAALRKMDSLSVYRDVAKDESRVTCTKEPTREEKERDPFAREMYHAVPAPVRIRASEYSFDPENEKTKNARAFANMRVYREQVTHTGSILRLLRAGDEVRFEFRADWHSNGNVANARLHADILSLLVYRAGNLVADYELDHSICPDNLARMVRNVEPSKWWKEQAFGKVD